ncbi:transposase [Streptomyces sp. NPDC051636]|uniref:transposase n=1 Tax=Streptomyces sp. NPDC051636 TaxID=3365663 RepID=UPI0037A2D609
MSDQAEHGRELVPVQHHQFRISDEDGTVGPDLPREHNGLVEVQDGIATIHTGIHTGDVDVTVTLHVEAPQPGNAEWDEIVELSLHSVSGELMVRGLMDDLDEELPVLSFDGPGDYRLRIHARGRDEIPEWRRESKDLPPGRLRLASPYDTDARYGLKQGSWWNGYKIHISESCDDTDDRDSATGGQALIPGADGPPPRLITSIAITDATVTDAEMTEPVHHMLAARDLLPADHFVDSGYASAELIVGMMKNFGFTLVTPVLMNSSPQARAGAGFDRPRSPSTGTSGRPPAHAGTPAPGGARHPARHAGIVIKLDKETCRPCLVRDQCIRSKTGGRTLSLQPRELQEVLDHARLQQGDEQWRAKYGTRAGIEGTIHQAVAVTGMRRARYLGLQKTDLEHVFSAVALNLVRLDAWWNGHPLDRTRGSHLSRLDLSLAA